MQNTMDPYETVYDIYETVYEIPADLLADQNEEPSFADTVLKLGQEFAQARLAGDSERLAELVTNDFVSLVSGGKGAILGSRRHRELRFVPEEVTQDGDHAFAWGQTMEVVTVGKEKVNVRGSFLWVLRRENGDWKIARSSQN